MPITTEPLSENMKSFFEPLILRGINIVIEVDRFIEENDENQTQREDRVYLANYHNRLCRFPYKKNYDLRELEFLIDNIFRNFQITN